jgi:hypothetical protein
MGRVGMNIGNVITSIALADLFDRNKDHAGHPTRPGRRNSDARTRAGQRGSKSFADHPERW